MGDPSPDIKKENNTPKPQNSLESLNSILAFQVQDLIDKKLGGAESRLREYNQVELKRLSDRWRIWAIAATVIAVLSILAVPTILKEWFKVYVKEYMTKPALKKVAKNTVVNEMSAFVKGEIDPLKKESDTLSEHIEKISNEIVAKQRDIESAQKLLREQLDIQQRVVAAKAGKRDKYEELKSIAEKKSEYKELVDAALKDIEFYYEAIKYQQTTPMLRDRISEIDPGHSIEEVIYFYRNSDVKLDMREAAIDTLIDYYNADKVKENVVQELCESVNSEQNLRVIARTTLLLSNLTGKSFRSLEIDAVREWWKQNYKETKYQSPFKHYLEALEYIPAPSVIDIENAKQAISLLDKIIQTEPDAFHARCLRGLSLIVLKDYDKAEKELKIVEERNKDFRWLLLYKSLLFACQNKIDEAVDLLNQALSKSPVLEEVAKDLAKNFTEYKKVVESKNVKWSSGK
jgi:tetratricopeptide (TPR) repeat protein